MKILPLLAFLAIAAYGQMQQRVAILNTMDDSDSIKLSDLAFLTSRLRETAVNVLPKQRYGVMTTESIIAFLGSAERAIKVCRESSCLAEIGRKVSADYVAQARLGKFGNDLAIKTELYEVKSGTLIGSFTGYSKDIYGLLTLIDEKAPGLFKQMPTVSSSPTATPPAVPPAVAFAAPQQDIAPAPIKPVLAPIAKPTTPPHPPIEWCDKMYNINEIIFKLKDGLLSQLKDCSLEQKPKMQCATDWIKKELPNDFPATNRILGFSSYAKLVNTVGSNYEDYDVSDKTMNLFLSEVKKLATDECIVDKPYKPPSNREQLKKTQPSLLSLGLPNWLYLGFRSGINFSQMCPQDEYADDDNNHSNPCSDNTLGMQLGLVFSIAMSELSYIQSGLMYDWHKYDYKYYGFDSYEFIKTIHYLKFPLLLSLKFSAFRLSVGPYFDLCILGNRGYEAGLNVGLGFDTGMFYIGASYDYGMSDSNYGPKLYNRTLGLNVGVNL